MSNYNDVKRVDEDIAKLAIEKNLLLERQLQSSDPNDIFKAQSYLSELEKNKKKKDIRSFLFDPFDAYYTTGGYKQQRKRVSFDVLKKVGDTPVVGSIINTRVFQIQNFLRFTDNEKEEGYIIQKKRSLFDKKKSKVTEKEVQKKIEYIVNFLENGGLKSKWDINDDLHDFVRKTMRDSLTYDQLAAECERNRRFELIGFTAIDASTIRILETVDLRFRQQSEQKYKEQFGHLPRYAQVYQSNVMHNPTTKEEIVYYPWELIYAQRNKSTAIDKNGYGTSEVEILLDIITWSLWGMQYNGNFFKQGSNPKGFINLKDGGVNMDVVNDFRQTWRQMIAGVNNCVHGDTDIITVDGLVTVGDLFKEDQKDKFLKIWDGEEFVDGRVYVSGKKQLNILKTNSGLEIKTSPIHKFKIIDDVTGLPVWKERKDIKVGDVVIIDNNGTYGRDVVKELIESEEFVDMYDVEMYNERHQFIANGLLISNSHKIPVFSGIDLEWVDLQSKNTDMEFQQWMEFLIVMLCSVYTIDPSELGYQFQKAAKIFGQEGQKERIQHSKKKGLKPLLIFLEKLLTKWIVSEIDEDYELKFTGIDNEDEMQAIEMVSKKLTAGVVSFESEFEKAMDRPYDPKTDTILNPTFLQAQQMKQYGGQDSNAAVDEMTGEEDKGAQNPFEEYGAETPISGGGRPSQNVMKSLKSDPILSQAMKYIDENLNIKD